MTDVQIQACVDALTYWGCRRFGRRLIAKGNPNAKRWLYTHVDTKPGRPAVDWSTDPWTLTSGDDRWYGLGASDSKAQLLNALSVVDDDDFVLVDTSEEADGDGEAAEAIATHSPGLLIICDGGADPGVDYYEGCMGQLDGLSHLATHHAPTHPARAVTDCGGPLVEFLSDARSMEARFTLTGVSAPSTERSLSLQEVTVRFDIRYTRAQQQAVTAFCDRWPVEVRQGMAPLQGERCLQLPGLSSGGIAPFSTRLSSVGSPLRLPNLLVVPGADQDNRNHQPNEFIRPHRMAEHREVLRRVCRLTEEYR